MIAYRIFQNIVQLFMYLFYRIEYRGLENIPQNQPLLVCSNHVSNADPMLVSYKVKKQVRYLGKQELVDNFFTGLLFRGVGVIPIKRGSGDTQAIDRCIEVIREGGVLGIFPEGGRSKTGELKKFKTGAVYIAREAKADVLPACVRIVGGTLKFKTKIIITYGPMIPFTDLGILDDNPRSLRKGKNILHETIQNLLEGSE